VTEQDIANIVAQWTGIPIEKVSSDETERLIKMEEVLHGRVIGQEEAVSAISRAIRRARVGLKNPNRPIASFIFAGPTGVGKSELAKTLASYYFGSEDAMVRAPRLTGRLTGFNSALERARRQAARPSGARCRPLAHPSPTPPPARPRPQPQPTHPPRCAWTCLSSWSATRCPSSSAARPATWDTRRGAS
jgi:hypothetical protein